MKNLLLLAALGALFSGCGPSSTASASEAGAGDAQAATNPPTNGTDSSGVTTQGTNADSASNIPASLDGKASDAAAGESRGPTDAQREMAQSSAPPSPGGTVTMKPKTGDEVAVMETAQGRIVLMFFPDKAPKHVASFKTLAKKGFFDGTAFHRVIPGFMIQGGDPNSDAKRATGPAGTGGPGYQIKAEPNDVKHVRGILSAARSQDRDSAGSQFFIMHKEYPSLDGEYDAYGQVVSGLEVVDKIVALPTDGNNMPTDIDQARVKSVRITKWPVK